MDTVFLLARLRKCDERWSKAMARKGYPEPDESTPEKPFTPREFELYCFADAWRDAFHKYEGLLYQQPDIREGMITGLCTREPLTIYEAT